MNRNDLLYITLMIIGFLAAGVLIITLAPSVWWLGAVSVFVAIIIALWVLSIFLVKKKPE